MPQYAYATPGAAATSSLDAYLREQEAQRLKEADLAIRQQQVQQQTAEQQAQLAETAKYHAMENAWHEEDRKYRISKEETDSQEKKREKLATEASEMPFGFIPDDATLQQYDKVGLGWKFPIEKDPESPLFGKRGYMGTAKERTEAQQLRDAKKANDELAKTLPPDKQAQFRALTQGGSKPLTPADAKDLGLTFANPNADTEPLFRRTPQGNVERSTTAGWVPYQGDVPVKHAFVTEPPPKDTSAKEDRENAHLDNVHHTAMTEIDNVAKPIQNTLETVPQMVSLLGQKTAEADALVAPLLLKATVSGTGTGFRMTRAEIDNVLKGATKWEQLQQTLNKWSSSPQKAVIPDDQRAAMLKIARAIEDKANRLHRKIIDVRHKIDDATTPSEIHKLQTTLQDELFTPDVDMQPEASHDQPLSAADMIKAIRAGKK